jgi:mitochondrial fission protein ELM1
VIAAGWRAGRVALGLRRMLPGLKIVQLMDPYGAYGCFDAIYLPSHDRKARSLAQKHRHIGMTTGALHRLTQEKIVAAARHTTPILSALPERYLLVMLGGSTRRGKMTEADAKRLARSISKRAEATGLAVALVTSRRTPTDSRRWMQRDLPPGSRWLEWSSQPDWPNPYPAVLAKAAEIVVTGDSMSMLSEACITGQLVWIADIGAAVSDKHRRFHRLLEQAGHAMPLAGDQDFSPIILDETHRVAADIMHQEWYCSALDA